MFFLVHSLELLTLLVQGPHFKKHGLSKHVVWRQLCFSGISRSWRTIGSQHWLPFEVTQGALKTPDDQLN